MLARPFAALRPRPDMAQAVIAPPYDVVDADEARALAAGRAESFLHISRPEIDLEPGTDPYSDLVYARGAANLAALVTAGVLERDERPSYYVYRMKSGSLVQTGIALAGSVRAYEAGRIHAHELTRPDKEGDRVRNIEALNAQTGPVLLAHKADAWLTATLEQHAAAQPLLEAVGQHDVEHSVWKVDDEREVAVLTAAIEALGDLYIADGHHRSAAAARVAEARRAQNAAADASHEFFLCVAFGEDQMQVFDYNRVVTDLNGLTTGDFLTAVGERFVVSRSDEPVRPRSKGDFGMYVDGQWYGLEGGTDSASEDPVARLDVSILQNHLIAPILGVNDPRTDSRIAFVGGVRGLAELERRVDDGRAAVAFSLHPTGLGDLMDVADAGLLMPPKSTWFEPKLADGLLTHVLD